MRITVLGAGPAGLYFGILAKRADPTHEITVLERNPPDATFGWGVVFSAETLGSLRDADPPTYLEITDTFARWSAIDIRYQGRRLRSRGHSFSAIARKRLLAILQRRCREVGVDLRFGIDVSDVDGVAAEADLVVAADGVNSLVRRSAPRVFGAKVSPQGGKYAWFGTDLVLDAFTFIFRETEFGLFQVHAYPFDENTSTFIVECAEPTWRAAGLAEADEAASIAFCERLFAEDLDGHRLMSNRSTWQAFQLVRNRDWHHGNTVLLGDAAHTAHFSIGSGTKLAMEDAIALAGALSTNADLESALVEYELDRQPVVERFQQAAGESVGYFQRVGQHTDRAPIQFAFNLLTRSGRISHAALTVRDPDFTRLLDSWFSGTRGIAPPPAFAPLRIGETLLRNRIVRTSVAADAGLVLTGMVAATPDGRRCPDTPLLDAEQKSVVDEAHRLGALAGLCLGHAGRRGATADPARGVDIPLPAGQDWPLIAASALPYGPRSATPRAMDGPDFARITEAFAANARQAAEAGFDLLELDLAHGHLLAGFLSPLTNQRTDDYGGSLANRLRFPLAVLRAVAAQWPADRVLAARLSVTDWARGGLEIADGIEIAKALVAAGIDLIHIVAGQTVAEGRPEYGRGFLTTLSDRVRGAVRVPTLVGGYLTSVDEANTVLGAGRAELCLLESSPTELERQVWPD
ncbi:MAG TPA: FAD-dependent monooxygenase [Pseudonocardiaceae bacterium]|jgi:anthraniloyl-CoA monooxygenase|nr:FAD-dependent monooxygenase [Pseudonocardiaceae bacterium]